MSFCRSLHGENPLAQESLSQASHAYDKHVLSKIGKSTTPPRQRSATCADPTYRPDRSPSHASSRESSHTQRVSVADLAAGDAWARWVASPSSAGVSPQTTFGWRDSGLAQRSPSVDSAAPAAGAPDFASRFRDRPRRSTSSSAAGLDDGLGAPSRSQRGSWDHGAVAEAEADLPGEETGGLRVLSLAERRSFSKQGMKRRALSPPAEAGRNDKVALPPAHASLSSASSLSPRTNSVASSVVLSAGGSSLTSVSSLDRHSPGPISPWSEHDPPPSTPGSANSASAPIAAGRPHFPSRDHKPPSTARKMSLPSSGGKARQSPVPRLGGMFICECCPKKPKKFESEEELRYAGAPPFLPLPGPGSDRRRDRAHESEKQYGCQFCNNRFKNKNEAERHQNSLHLRRQSWSCAAITNYQAAFTPATAHDALTIHGPAHDVCGYCGQDFPNFPAPDWERRFEHMTGVHKYGECNQGKKFWRADHFRQHLKHSHAGTSGKWTNVLENACMKEPAPEMPALHLGHADGLRVGGSITDR